MTSQIREPAEYLADLTDDWRREILLELRELVRASAPDAVEGMAYGMLSYTLGDTTLFHLHAQKGYVSLYVGDASKIDPDGRMLAGLDVGKGCIRFKKSNVVEETGVGDFVAETVRRAREGLDIDC